MKSINFEFLGDDWSDLAALGGFAEAYAHTDPQSALVKLRAFAERMTGGVYSRLGLPSPPQSNLIDLLQSAAFREVTPKVVQDKLHVLRIYGNKAAHGESVTQDDALWLIKEAHDLARWFYVAHLGGQVSDCAEYKPPPAGSADAKTRLKQEKKAAFQQLAAQEAKLTALLAELEQARAQAATAAQQLADLKAAATTAQQAADQLHFDEATTRQRLIDSKLPDTGWQVGWNGANTEEVTQEEPVEHQPTVMTISQDLVRRVDSAQVSDIQRDWTGNDESARNYHGVVSLNKSPLRLRLSWKKSSSDTAKFIGVFDLDLRQLLAAQYVRIEPRRQGDIRLRFYHCPGDDVIYIQSNLQGPALPVGKVPC